LGCSVRFDRKKFVSKNDYLKGYKKQK